MGGWYHYILGLNLNRVIKTEQLPKFKPLMSEKEYAELSHALSSNKTGIDHLDEHVYPKMFGYKNRFDYYEKNNLSYCVQNIKVPTFALGSIDD